MANTSSVHRKNKITLMMMMMMMMMMQAKHVCHDDADEDASKTCMP
jgi:hypothetical protein